MGFGSADLVRKYHVESCAQIGGGDVKGKTACDWDYANHLAVEVGEQRGFRCLAAEGQSACVCDAVQGGRDAAGVQV